MTNSITGGAPNQFVQHHMLGPLAYMRPEDLLPPFMYVREEQPSGTAGGSAAATTYYDRTLNTVVSNTIPGASLSSNQVTLLPGTYDFDISTTCYANGNGGFRSYLYNVTDSSVVAFGPSSGAYQAFAPLMVRVILTASKTLKVRTYSIGTYATHGLGLPVSVAGQIEIYSEMRIYKVGQ